MNTFPKVQGDIGDTIIVRLNGVEDLAAADTVRALVHHTQTGDTDILDAAILDPDDRTVQVECGDDAGYLTDATPGAWNLEYEVTFLDGSILTWPAERTDQIRVRADIDPGGS